VPPGGLKPAACVVVATVRALKMHGGVAQGRARPGGRGGGEARCREPRRHVENIGKFGVPVVVG
jgi:formate--tetrahydrofolate ligase